MTSIPCKQTRSIHKNIEWATIGHRNRYVQYNLRLATRFTAIALRLLFRRASKNKNHDAIRNRPKTLHDWWPRSQRDQCPRAAKSHEKPINDRGRVANSAARPYWNFFLLIFGALHINNNIIINYKLVLFCWYWVCLPLQRISPADGPFYCDCTVCTKWICTWRRFISCSCCFKCSFFKSASCLVALDGWKTNTGEYMRRWVVVGIFDNYPVSTMTVKSKPLIILKIGVGQKLLVCQTTYMRKVHKPSLLWIRWNLPVQKLFYH